MNTEKLFEIVGKLYKRNLDLEQMNEQFAQIISVLMNKLTQSDLTLSNEDYELVIGTELDIKADGNKTNIKVTRKCDHA